MIYLIMIKIIYIFFIFVLIPACLYSALNRENIDVKDFRINSGYMEVMLSDGITAYKDIGCLLYTSPSPRDS